MARRRNPDLPGMVGKGVEDKRIKAIDDAYEAYADAKEKRMSLTEREVETRTKLIATMKHHNVMKYRYDGKIVECSAQDAIKVTKIKEPSGD